VAVEGPEAATVLLFDITGKHSMKQTYIFGAILACSAIGTLTGARAAKTALLVVSGLLAAYGLFRLLG
jgi:hypothetical protein